MKLCKLMFEGPEDELTLTANAQPALMATSMAGVKVLETETDFKRLPTRPMSLGTRSANIRRCARPGSLTSKTQRGSCACRREAMQKAVSGR